MKNDIFENFPSELAEALDIMQKEFDIESLFANRKLIFSESNILSVNYNGNIVNINYDTPKSAMRGLGLAMADISSDGEKNTFEKFGIMIDCSRNAVMKIDYAKKVLLRLALLGYNMVMLYTEDTYELPDEPHFGYLRGAYSAAEICELDAFAAKLGIELVGCIQTLGHLATFLRSTGSNDIRDTASVLLAEEEKTYVFISKMLDFWQTNCRSRHIHIGMDETHDLGRGKFMDIHGQKRNFDIFNGHLQRVCELCKERGLEPMIWSDMYFCMGSKKRAYYDPEADIPADAVAAIPENVKLVYWDYYHTETKIYDDMIKAHCRIGKTPPMASGLWTWFRFIYDYEYTKERVIPCIEAARKNDLKEFFYTMWGDDGAYCGYESVFAGLIFGADCAYGVKEDVERCEKLSNALKVPSFKHTLHASKMNYQCQHRDNGAGSLAMLMWDDPITGLGSFEIQSDSEPVYSELLQALKNGSENISDLPYSTSIGKYLAGKLSLRYQILQAYKNKDIVKLRKLIDIDLPDVLAKADILAEEFRRQWVSHYKYNGMESMQIRIAGQTARLHELSRRVAEFIEGKTDSIPEFETVRDERCRLRVGYYHEIAAPGLF